MVNNEKRFFIDFNSIRFCYPCEVSKKVSNLGVLEQYRDKKYTLKEMNEIIASLIIKTPYISNSMFIHINIMNGGAYHYILDIKNYEYGNQERFDDVAVDIEFLY